MEVAFTPKSACCNIRSSSLPNALEISGGALDVPYFTGKNLVEKHIRECFEGFVTFLYAGWWDTCFPLGAKIILAPAHTGIYCSSWKKHFTPRLAADGTVEFGSGFAGTTQIPVFDVTDAGASLSVWLI